MDQIHKDKQGQNHKHGLDKHKTGEDNIEPQTWTIDIQKHSKNKKTTQFFI